MTMSKHNAAWICFQVLVRWGTNPNGRLSLISSSLISWRLMFLGDPLGQNNIV